MGLQATGCNSVGGKEALHSYLGTPGATLSCLWEDKSQIATRYRVLLWVEVCSVPFSSGAVGAVDGSRVT